MPNSVHVPVLGQVPKGALFAGALAAVGVGGYLLYRKSKQNAAASSTGTYGYGATAYGYGTSAPGYYGYGAYNYGAMGGGVQPYPVGSEYGYGAYGYGYYNPYTGQYLGGGVGSGPTQGFPPVTTGGGPNPPPPPPKPKPTPHTITADGHQNLQQLAVANHVPKMQILEWNPHLGYLWGSGKPVPRGTRVKV